MSNPNIRGDKYLVVDSANVTEIGLKKLTDEFKKAGAPVASVDATNRKIRKDSQYTKKARLSFENGQFVDLFVGPEGDIYQIKLNGRAAPVPEETTEKGFAKSLTETMKRNQSQFDNSLQAKAARASQAPKFKSLSRPLSTRLQEARDQVTALNASKAVVEQALDAARANKTAADAEYKNLTAKLEAERKETADLKTQLATLQESQS
ncbi:hypothetical protein L4174_023755 (plasmid) [Photobacterium sp. CCB-ST2H9]|uniref:defense against restriction DarA-related protein n=1 Tax=Photobacterium sp. CCB-ST2H9 TaxID=2912855 RepID=UPI0020069B04|nr:hypothetical protein [Photobacterium sp. CCB-ST2H9]UTM60484.1 hypothetical protein L4174_023755 [Photobacterium sp. CCB-ST2H9]